MEHSQKLKTLCMTLCMLLAAAWTDSLSAKQIPDFRSAFALLNENRAVYQQYEDDIYNSRIGDKEWLDFMKNRSQAYARMYGENAAAIRKITSYFTRPSNKVQSEAYDSLYAVMVANENTLFDDPFFLEQLTNYLLPHYEALQDSVKLLPLYRYAGFCSTQFAMLYEPEQVPEAARNYRKLIELGRLKSELNGEQAMHVCKAYINMGYQLASLGGVNPKDAMPLVEDFETFYTRHKQVLGEDQQAECEFYIDMLQTASFRIYFDQRDSYDEEDSVAVVKMFELSPFGTDGLAAAETAEDSVNYYYSMAFLEKMPFSEAYAKTSAIILEQFRSFEAKDSLSEVEVLDISNSLLTNIAIMNNTCDLDENSKVRNTLYCVYRLFDLVQRARIVDDFLFDYILRELASEPQVMMHIPPTLKEQFLAELAVKGQIGTVGHVNMVAMLCDIMLDCLLDECPEQFVGVMGYKDAEDVQRHRNQLMQYMSMAAHFHDIGKIAMADIISNNFRPLTDHEFDIIHRHPETSQKYLSIDPMFEKYKDVALGHHKWYNGKGGYPESFDNTASPWRPIIDVLTLCDCLDAATDYLNRTYSITKPVEVVLKEFKAQAGTRYNPVMVGVLLRDTYLQERLKRICVEERANQARLLRQRFVSVVR